MSVKYGYDMNSLAVPRKAKEAIGGIAALKKPDGGTLTINVEYNLLDPLLRASGWADGDVNDDTGYSPYPGKNCRARKPEKGTDVCKTGMIPLLANVRLIAVCCSSISSVHTADHRHRQPHQGFVIRFPRTKLGLCHAKAPREGSTAQGISISWCLRQRATCLHWTRHTAS